MFRPSPRFCNLCSHRLLYLFTNGIAPSLRVSTCGGKFLLRKNPKYNTSPLKRAFTTHRTLNASVEDGNPQSEEDTKSSSQKEAIVREARQIFGETLPKNFLLKEEYLLYERLYGPPSATTLPEDIDLLMGKEDNAADGADDVEGPDAEANVPLNALFRENKDGDLEEVRFEDDPEGYSELVEEAAEELESDEEQLEMAGVDEAPEQKLDQELTAEDIMDELRANETQDDSPELHATISRDPAIEEIFRSRIKRLQEQHAANKDQSAPEKNQAEEDVQINEKEPEESMEVQLPAEEDFEEDIEDEDIEYETSSTVRGHPRTVVGRFGTSPSTIQLPKETFVGPTTALFADASNKHLKEIAEKTFGGQGLPDSTATIRRPNLKQQAIPLEASQSRIGEMEANAYLAVIYPGAYASVMSALVEVRKRLGSDWLRGLMAQPSGPRILDGGAGGAAVLAWRDVIQAEFDAMHPDKPPKFRRPPFGKSTVVTGSPSLRQRASTLLDNTSFIPRLPDYDPSRDHPSLESSNPQPRKQYDIIIAPYTLWSLREDHMRKSQIQNFWSLLDPRGGVLILIEKGVPRGFELVAGARETLLKHHVSSPGSEQVESSIDSANPNRFTHKEQGMIIAPCTNHGKCPMYITAGKSQGRKDFCHFNQRFIRPPYLQRIVGQNDQNHEDISFSYVAFQRGKDLRIDESLVQGIPAADAAFKGYEDFDDDYDAPSSSTATAATTTPEPNKASPGGSAPNPLTLPRAILPPIKRRGHVILDLCTPAATIERWTVPKSFSKQAYRDARKSKWGDLWALGAKTRVLRNIRVGMKQKLDKAGRKRERAEMAEEERMDREDEEEEGERTMGGGLRRGNGGMLKEKVKFKGSRGEGGGRGKGKGKYRVKN